MNRRRKNEDVFTQLGEPLPLPYKTDGIRQSSATRDETRELLSTDALYKRSDTEQLRKLEQEVETESQKAPAFKPIQLSLHRLHPIRRQLVQRSQDLELIDTIENELEYIKNLAADNKLTARELRLLRDIQAQLQTQILEDPAPVPTDEDPVSNGHVTQDLSPIMEELEKLQGKITERNTISRTRLPSVGSYVKRSVLIILCTIIFLSIPYLLGLSRYDYCYYYCWN